MKRLTTNKNVADMGMSELAYNACYIKDGRARYRDYGLDMDAKELARILLKDYTGVDDAFTDEEEFDEQMVECIIRGMGDTEGVIAAFYRNLWAMADLREALKRYEDLEEQGKLQKLPCAVGDTVYRINKGAKEPVIEMTVLEIGTITLKPFGLAIQLKCCDNADKGETYYFNDDFGKNVFFSREKAEVALEELEKREKTRMKNAMDIQKRNMLHLFKLIKQNPELPIVPMVNCEVVEDDCALYWMGSWGAARIDSYILRKDGIWYLSEGIEEIFDNLFEFPIDISKEQEEKFMKDAVSSLPWIKAIIVKIEPPEM